MLIDDYTHYQVLMAMMKKADQKNVEMSPTKGESTAAKSDSQKTRTNMKMSQKSGKSQQSKNSKHSHKKPKNKSKFLTPADSFVHPPPLANNRSKTPPSSKKAGLKIKRTASHMGSNLKS